MIKTNKKYLYSLIVLFIFSIIINYLSIYNIVLYKNIENTIRTIFIINIVLITLFFNIFLYKTSNKKYFTSVTILFILYLIILIIVNYNLNSIYGKISKIATNNKLYSASIVTNVSNNNDDIFKIDKIGIINNKDSIEGYIIPQKIIKDNHLKIELIYYDDYVSMINDLLDNNIEYIFLPSNYKIKFDDITFKDSIDNTKVIYTQDQEFENKINNNKKVKEPFTILLMGVDSEKDNINNSSFNGDALILLTYNPDTYSATLLSIPRDTYINISCLNNRKNKVTHAAWDNDTCIVDSLNNNFNIKIDYYVKINFKGLVRLVDNLNGIEVEVPYNLCESNSDRLWGDNTIYIEEGIQTLNGEQALALTRNRHPWPEYCDSKWTNYTSSDIIRGNNQQLVLNGIINKVKDIKSLDTIYSLLDIINSNISTNISTDNILSFYNTSKDLDKIQIQKLYLNGYDEYIYDYDYINNKGTKLTLYNYIPYKSSIDLISKTMNDNLNGNLTVSDEVIGEIEDDNRLNLMPNFTGKNYNEAVSFCEEYNIKLNINYVEGFSNGIITYQNINENTDIEYVDTLNINVTKNTYNKNELNTDNHNNNQNTENNKNIESNTNEKEKEDNKKNELDPIITELIN